MKESAAFVLQQDTLKLHCFYFILYQTMLNWIIKFAELLFITKVKCVEHWAHHYSCPISDSHGHTESQVQPSVRTADAPKHPELASEDSRMSTFFRWPLYSPISPRRLAKAGFFYTCELHQSFRSNVFDKTKLFLFCPFMKIHYSPKFIPSLKKKTATLI